MSTYRAIVVKKIKSLSSDPTEGADGQMWYNTTTQSIRGLGITEAWSSAAPLNFARGGMGNASATQTAGLVFGGYVDPGNYYTNNEESQNFHRFYNVQTLKHLKQQYLMENFYIQLI